MSDVSEEPLQRGWMIPVLTEREGGGRPMLVVYLVGIEDKEAAIQAVNDFDELLEGSWIDGEGPVGPETVERYELERGEVRNISWDIRA